ncbi:MAG: urate hydroxylase PuuD [Parvularculaceae bacterium]|nr:urate hydroxylase PuuD [Parvularculaceae bacterium]
MTAILTNLRNAVIAGFVLAIVLVVLYATVWGGSFDDNYWRFLVRWTHVIAGIMWIGHLYYFNFTQIPTMPKIPDELKPAIGKFIAPEALFWFRWGAMVTMAAGLILAMMNGYFVEAMTLGLARPATEGQICIGIGMWLGLIMWFNVWFIIWPNQQKALNIADKHPNLDKDAKAKHARTAMLFSRTNTVLSVPMLFAMVAAQGLFNIS